MSCDDSLVDSDEIISLYSSKNIMETFRTQLQKIVANNKYVSNVSSQMNNEGICTETERSTNQDIQIVSKNQEVNCGQNTTAGKMGHVSLNKCTKANEVQSPDDSIEVIEDFTPKPARQSQRLRNKRAESGVQYSESSSLNSDVAVIGQITHRSQKSKRKKQKKGKPIQEVTLDDDSPQPSEVDDELNPEISVKVIWKSVNIKKFMIRKFQKLSHIFELISKEENIAKDKIILTFNSIMINPDDTPDSLNLQVYHFLDGGVLNKSTNLCSASKLNTQKFDGESVVLKFQDINKKIITVNLNKNDKLKVGMIICSEQLEIPLNRIKFYFDGELVQPSETPETLGLEGGEVIDMKTTD